MCVFCFVCVCYSSFELPFITGIFQSWTVVNDHLPKKKNLSLCESSDFKGTNRPWDLSVYYLKSTYNTDDAHKILQYFYSWLLTTLFKINFISPFRTPYIPHRCINLSLLFLKIISARLNPFGWAVWNEKIKMGKTMTDVKIYKNSRHIIQNNKTITTSSIGLYS